VKADPQLIGLISLAFAGAVQLFGVAFILGGLFARVRQADLRLDALEKGERGEAASRTGFEVQMGKLETTVELTNKAVTDTLDGMQRELRGLARQVAALASQRPGAKPPLADAQTDE
jgi:hypothetical protein